MPIDYTQQRRDDYNKMQQGDQHAAAEYQHILGKLNPEQMQKVNSETLRPMHGAGNPAPAMRNNLTLEDQSSITAPSYPRSPIVEHLASLANTFDRIDPSNNPPGVPPDPAIFGGFSLGRLLSGHLHDLADHIGKSFMDEPGVKIMMGKKSPAKASATGDKTPAAPKKAVAAAKKKTSAKGSAKSTKKPPQKPAKKAST